jgi:3-isopropylmalate/(R)-2-methylmalate dehydratase small subunit
MEPISVIVGQIVALPVPDIDTDRIIPARYLKVTDKEGLADGLFFDWRYRADGSPNPEFVLNRPDAQDATVLVAGPNFGCGSSREHAPWALQGYGFRAVISPSFADIFRNNSINVGLLPVQVDDATYLQLVSLFDEDPATQVRIDLAAQTLTLPDGRAVAFPIDAFSRHCLLNGVDQLGFLLSGADAIAAFEAQHPIELDTTR